MKASSLKNIFNEFDHKCNYIGHSELNSGHINDTFLVNTEEDNVEEALSENQIEELSTHE